MKKLHITENLIGERLDKGLAMLMPEHSRVFWQERIDAEQIRVNGVIQPKNYLLELNDVISVLDNMSSAETDKRVIDFEVPIIYEDNQVLVINKPAGVVTHPAHAQDKVTIAEWATHYCSEIKTAIYDKSNPVSVARAGIVHRLDKDTSGVMIIAKNAEAMRYLAKQIQTHQTAKKYLALLFGHLEQSPLNVHNWLSRSLSDRRQMTQVAAGQGREAETVFTIKQTLKSAKRDKATLAEVTPITGRTHQIRVHAKIIGHPVLGDAVYNSPESTLLSERLGLRRQWLHAESLTIVLPHQSKTTTFIAPLPEDLEKSLKQFVVSSQNT